MASFRYRTNFARSIAQIDAMCARMATVMVLEEVEAAERDVIFTGRFRRPPDRTLSLAIERLRPFERTPYLRRRNGRDCILAVRGLHLPKPPPLSTRIVWASCLLACLVTTIAAGSFTINPSAGFWELLNSIVQLDWHTFAGIVTNGLPFSVTLLLILAFHELGHYLAARAHGVQASPPFFIPLPFGIGTLGAFIRLRSPVPNRRALFDISLAGPAAGFLTALAFFIIGLWLSRYATAQATYLIGNSPLGDMMIAWVYPDFLHSFGQLMHPVTISAWIGLSLTAVNLIPVGQLDGGHLAYAVLGQHSRWLTAAALALLLLAGLYWPGWFVWAVFLLFFIRRPDTVQDPFTPIGRPRLWLSLGLILWFALIFSLEPF